MDGKDRMMVRAAVAFAAVSWVVCMALIAAGALLSFRNGFESGFSPYLLNNAVAVLGCSTVGALVAARRPENPIGWLFILTGFLYGLTVFAGEYGVYALFTAAGPLPGGAFAIWVGAWAWIPAGLLILLVFLLFPDGRLPSPRWRFVTLLIVLDICLSTAQYAFRPGPLLGISHVVENPFGIDGARGLLDLVAAASLPLSLAASLVPVVALVARFRRAWGEERQQIKWFAYAAALLAIAIAVVSAWPHLEGSIAGLVLFLVGFLAVPAAMGIAILRHNLYDIDIVINRTLVYATLTASLLLVYLGSVVSLQYAFRALTGEESRLVVVASTLLIAALFNSFRRYIQNAIDRRFYRRKYDAARTLETFGARLRDETDLDSLTRDLVSVVRETVQPEHASLWMRPGKNSLPTKNSLS